MGRGENNLLFTPHLLKKGNEKRHTPQRGQSGTFLVGAKDLILSEELTLLRDERQGLFALDKDLGDIRQDKLPPRISSEAEIALGDGKFVWGDGDGFVIQDLSGKEGAIYKDNLPGILTGIYLNQETVFATALDSSNPSCTGLYQSSARDEGPWEEVGGYSYGHFTLIKGGEEAFLFYQPGDDKIAALVSLSSSGLGEMVFLPSGLQRRSDPKHLMTAISPDNFLAICENEAGGLDLCHLSSESSGVAQEKIVASLGAENGIKSTAFTKITSSGGRALLLGNQELLLANSQGILTTIPLKKDESDLSELTFFRNRALLWEKDGDSYQEFFLP